MPSPLALYRTTCPKIVWVPQQAVIGAVYEDDFQSYANTAAMLAVWPFTQGNVPPGSATLDPTGGEGGVKAMKIAIASGTGGGHLGGYVSRDFPGLLYQSQTVAVRMRLGAGVVADDAYWGRYDIGVGQSGGSMVTVARTTAWQTVTLHDVPRFASNTVIRLNVGLLFLAYYTVGAPIEIWVGNVRLVEPGTAAVITNTLDIGFPLARARSWTAPSPGSDRVLYPSGEETAWIDEHDAFLEGTVIHIPASDGSTNFSPATGWNSAAGWQRFLEFAWAGNPFSFWRDRDDGASALNCYLVEPKRGSTPSGSGFLRDLTIRLRTADLQRFTRY